MDSTLGIVIMIETISKGALEFEYYSEPCDYKKIDSGGHLEVGNTWCTISVNKINTDGQLGYG